MPELTITTVVAGGDGLAREDSGRVVFVRGGLPGERVEVEFVEQRKDFARAEITRVVVASPDRVEPPCAYVAAGCGGCAWQHIAPAAQPQFKRDIVVDALRRIARIENPPVAECVPLPSERYRTTLRVAITRDGRPALRKHASHDLVQIDDCLVCDRAIAARLRDERWPEGHEVVLRVDDFVVHGRTFQVSADSFFQVSTAGAGALVDLVQGALQANDVTDFVDLYAGVGLFAALLHDAGYTALAAVEGNPAAAADARRNLERLCPVVETDVTRWEGRAAEAVIADPSRDGLRAAGVATVLRCEPRVIVLVSCDAAALGRDAKLLAAAGFALRTARPVDLFPHTPHVEVVSTFVRL